jgi:hypothetical protein
LHPKDGETVRLSGRPLILGEQLKAIQHLTIQKPLPSEPERRKRLQSPERRWEKAWAELGT